MKSITGDREGADPDSESLLISTQTVTFATAGQTVSESAGTVTVGVVLNTAIDSAVTIPFSVSGTANSPADHSLASGTITIPAWNRSAAITFSVVDDAIFEASKTVILTLGPPAIAALGATAVHTVTRRAIRDRIQPIAIRSVPLGTRDRGP